MVSLTESLKFASLLIHLKRRKNGIINYLVDYTVITQVRYYVKYTEWGNHFFYNPRNNYKGQSRVFELLEIITAFIGTYFVKMN